MRLTVTRKAGKTSSRGKEKDTRQLAENQKPHHLYGIVNKEDGDIFKYGISDGEIGEDGLSKRIRFNWSC